MYRLKTPKSSKKDFDFSNLHVVVTRGPGEDKLATALTELQTTIQPPSHQFHLHRCALKVGDILIGYRQLEDLDLSKDEVRPMSKLTLNISLKTLTDENLSTPIPDLQPLVLIERKDIPDFVNSFKTNHYQNQKTRMMAFRQETNQSCLCALVVERYYDAIDLRGYCCREQVSTLESAFTSIQLRDHFILKHVTNVQEHALFLYKCLRTIIKYRLWEGHHYQSVQKLQTDYQDSIKIQKKANLTPSLCYQLQLNAIPGISMPMAKAIAETYPNLDSLMQVLRAESPSNVTNPHTPNLKTGKPVPKKYHLYSLKELPVGTQKLGPVKALRLHDYLLQPS